MASPFLAKDGSKHTNRETAKRADARFGAQAQQGGMQKMGMGGGDGEGEGGEGEGMEPQDGAAMAQEHGPATDLQIHHEHEAGVHTVHAVHPDGHEHDTEHGSADEAHKYAADCAGVGSGMQ